MSATKKPRTLSYNRLTGILHLSDARGEIGYYVDRLACQWTAAAYRLTKIVATPGEPDHYDVLLAAVGGSCECLGHLRHGHCKHFAALRCLRERGSI